MATLQIEPQHNHIKHPSSLEIAWRGILYVYPIDADKI